MCASMESRAESPMLNLSRLEKVRRRGRKHVARCPACAEDGGDQNGEHLFIAEDGRFGCVKFPGPDGDQHRKRIFQLAGVPDKTQLPKTHSTKLGLNNRAWATLDEGITAMER